MRRLFLTLIGGLGAAAVAYYCAYFIGTRSARHWEHSGQPELAWLKSEFQLSDAEFFRVSELHAAYLPRCKEMCRRIAEQNSKIQELISEKPAITPELEKAIAESARLRGECQKNMLAHFFSVSETMPSTQRLRYLDWVVKTTLLPEAATAHMGHDSRP